MSIRTLPTNRSDVTADDERLRRFYDAHASALLGYAMRLTGGDRGKAEDIVQETFVRAWRHAKRLEDDGRPLRPWLYTVAQRIAIDGHRARVARPPETSGAELLAVPAADAIDNALDRVLLQDALSALSEEHRTAIVETYYRGRTVGEAAQVLGVPPGTIKSRCYYALRALKLAIEERGATA